MPTTRSPAAAHTSHCTSKKNAIVPIVMATSMIVTEVHAAGECPWPGSAVSMLMMLLRAGFSWASLAVRLTVAFVGGVVAAAQPVPVVDRAIGCRALGRGRRA